MNWIMLPKNYGPDTVDSRRESGQEYVKYYSAAAYEQLLCDARKLRDCLHAYWVGRANTKVANHVVAEFDAKYGVK